MVSLQTQLAVSLQSPFQRQEPGSRRLLVPAFYMPTRVTFFPIIQKKRPGSQMVSPSGPISTRTTSSEVPTDKKSASVSTSMAVQLVQGSGSMRHKTGSTPALSAGTNPIMHSHDLAAQMLEEFLKIAVPLCLLYPQFSAIHHRSAFDCSIHTFLNIFNAIILSYNINAFDAFLQKYNLLGAYSNLISNLQHGFPLSDRMPKLSSTHIIPNHPSFFDHPQPIKEYFTKEVTVGRMSGPFPQSEIEAILRGPFQSSLFIVAVQPQAPGELDKICVCRHLSKAMKTIPSVNPSFQRMTFPLVLTLLPVLLTL